MDGYIHSIESFGTVDGPGVRMVVFLQGCPMRCLYCHNPDTWEISRGTRMSALDIIRQYERNQAFYTHGGLTVTGGEPLLQVDFLLELFSLAKERGMVIGWENVCWCQLTTPERVLEARAALPQVRLGCSHLQQMRQTNP